MLLWNDFIYLFLGLPFFTDELIKNKYSVKTGGMDVNEAIRQDTSVDLWTQNDKPAAFHESDENRKDRK